MTRYIGGVSGVSTSTTSNDGGSGVFAQQEATYFKRTGSWPVGDFATGGTVNLAANNGYAYNTFKITDNSKYATNAQKLEIEKCSRPQNDQQMNILLIKFKHFSKNVVVVILMFGRVLPIIRFTLQVFDYRFSRVFIDVLAINDRKYEKQITKQVDEVFIPL